jgi:hypothetical protein
VDSEDGTIPPAQMELGALLRDPDAYEAIVDALPRCPAKLLLQRLGLLHRLYPSRPEPLLAAGPDITLTLHVTGAPAITLVFDAARTPQRTSIHRVPVAPLTLELLCY